MKPNLKVGDLVMVVDHNTPRYNWSVGMVEAVIPGGDDLVRTAKVRMGNSDLDGNGRPKKTANYIERPIHKLICIMNSEY